MQLSDLAMMKLDAAEKATGQVRTLAFGGLGVVWLFAGPFFEGTNTDRPDRALFAAGAVLAITLALDLAQIVARTVILELIYRDREGAEDAQLAIEAGEDPEVTDLGPVLAAVTGVLFIAKIAALVIAYVFIVTFFVHAAT